MKIYNRQDFLKLPPGVVYCSGRPYAFGTLSVKADTLGTNDFVRLGLGWIDSYDSGQAGERLDEMLATGASYPMDECYGRDGGFDDEEVFLVFEAADLRKLIQMFTEAAELVLPLSTQSA